MNKKLPQCCGRRQAQVTRAKDALASAARVAARADTPTTRQLEAIEKARADYEKAQELERAHALDDSITHDGEAVA